MPRQPSSTSTAPKASGSSTPAGSTPRNSSRLPALPTSQAQIATGSRRSDPLRSDNPSTQPLPSTSSASRGGELRGLQDSLSAFFTPSEPGVRRSRLDAQAAIFAGQQQASSEHPTPSTSSAAASFAHTTAPLSIVIDEPNAVPPPSLKSRHQRSSSFSQARHRGHHQQLGPISTSSTLTTSSVSSGDKAYSQQLHSRAKTPSGASSTSVGTAAASTSPNRRNRKNVDHLEDALSIYFSASGERRRKHEAGEYLHMSQHGLRPGVSSPSPLPPASVSRKRPGTSSRDDLSQGESFNKSESRDGMSQHGHLYLSEDEESAAGVGDPPKLRPQKRLSKSATAGQRPANNAGLVASQKLRQAAPTRYASAASATRKKAGTSAAASLVRRARAQATGTAAAPSGRGGGRNRLKPATIRDYFPLVGRSEAPSPPPKLSPQKPPPAPSTATATSSPKEDSSYRNTPWDIPDEDVQLFNKAREVVQQELYANSKRMSEAMKKHPTGTPQSADSSAELHYPPRIRIGRYEMATWYSAPYPQEYASLPLLHICEHCLLYLAVPESHAQKCKRVFPPGNEVYRSADASISVWEVDGNTARVYCRNLCLLAKLFIDHKTLYFDVEPFLFYVLTRNDANGCHFVGYFSKEKYSQQRYTLACIVTLPCYQGHGYGRFLIDFSYLLARRERLAGTPERPLSDLGKIAYQSYWRTAIYELLHDVCVVGKSKALSLADISEQTGIAVNDVVESLTLNEMLTRVNGSSTPGIGISINEQLLQQHWSKAKKNPSRIWLDERQLQWEPKTWSPSRLSSAHRSPAFSPPPPPLSVNGGSEKQPQQGKKKGRKLDWGSTPADVKEEEADTYLEVSAGPSTSGIATATNKGQQKKQLAQTAQSKVTGAKNKRSRLPREKTPSPARSTVSSKAADLPSETLGPKSRASTSKLSRTSSKAGTRASSPSQDATGKKRSSRKSKPSSCRPDDPQLKRRRSPFSSSDGEDGSTGGRGKRGSGWSGRGGGPSGSGRGGGSGPMTSTPRESSRGRPTTKSSDRCTVSRKHHHHQEHDIESEMSRLGGGGTEGLLSPIDPGKITVARVKPRLSGAMDSSTALSRLKNGPSFLSSSSSSSLASSQQSSDSSFEAEAEEKLNPRRRMSANKKADPNYPSDPDSSADSEPLFQPRRRGRQRWQNIAEEARKAGKVPMSKNKPAHLLQGEHKMKKSGRRRQIDPLSPKPAAKEAFGDVKKASSGAKHRYRRVAGEREHEKKKREEAEGVANSEEKMANKSGKPRHDSEAQIEERSGEEEQERAKKKNAGDDNENAAPSEHDEGEEKSDAEEDEDDEDYDSSDDGGSSSSASPMPRELRGRPGGVAKTRLARLRAGHTHARHQVCRGARGGDTAAAATANLSMINMGGEPDTVNMGGEPSPSASSGNEDNDRSSTTRKQLPPLLHEHLPHRGDAVVMAAKGGGGGTDEVETEYRSRPKAPQCLLMINNEDHLHSDEEEGEWETSPCRKAMPLLVDGRLKPSTGGMLAVYSEQQNKDDEAGAETANESETMPELGTPNQLMSETDEDQREEHASFEGRKAASDLGRQGVGQNSVIRSISAASRGALDEGEDEKPPQLSPNPIARGMDDEVGLETPLPSADRANSLSLFLPASSSSTRRRKSRGVREKSGARNGTPSSSSRLPKDSKEGSQVEKSRSNKGATRPRAAKLMERRASTAMTSADKQPRSRSKRNSQLSKECTAKIRNQAGIIQTTASSTAPPASSAIIPLNQGYAASNLDLGVAPVHDGAYSMLSSTQMAPYAGACNFPPDQLASQAVVDQMPFISPPPQLIPNDPTPSHSLVVERKSSAMGVPTPPILSGPSRPESVSCQLIPVGATQISGGSSSGGICPTLLSQEAVVGQSFPAPPALPPQLGDGGAQYAHQHQLPMPSYTPSAPVLSSHPPLLQMDRAGMQQPTIHRAPSQPNASQPGSVGPMVAAAAYPSLAAYPQQQGAVAQLGVPPMTADGVMQEVSIHRPQSQPIIKPTPLQSTAAVAVPGAKSTQRQRKAKREEETTKGKGSKTSSSTSSSKKTSKTASAREHHSACTKGTTQQSSCPTLPPFTDSVAAAYYQQIQAHQTYLSMVHQQSMNGGMPSMAPGSGWGPAGAVMPPVSYNGNYGAGAGPTATDQMMAAAAMPYQQMMGMYAGVVPPSSIQPPQHMPQAGQAANYPPGCGWPAAAGGAGYDLSSYHPSSATVHHDPSSSSSASSAAARRSLPPFQPAHNPPISQWQGIHPGVDLVAAAAAWHHQQQQPYQRSNNMVVPSTPTMPTAGYPGGGGSYATVANPYLTNS